VDQKIPFTTYDFWAYLSAGFLLLFGVDQAFAIHLLARDSWTVTQVVVAFSGAYTAGQLVAGLSSTVFEKLLVGRLLGNPRDVLFDSALRPRWLRWVIPGYFVELPATVRTAVLDKGTKIGATSSGEELFWPAFSSAKSVPSVMSRLENFLNLYGFCRNAACVAFLDAALLYWSYRQPGAPADHLLWSRLAVVAGIGLTLRYLKFYRLYAVEIFTTFAYSEEPEKKAMRKPF
jgi:hypothetical protein